MGQWKVMQMPHIGCGLHGLQPMNWEIVYKVEVIHDHDFHFIALKYDVRKMLGMIWVLYLFTV